ncbi:hypothetical protein K435DRAFT_812771 [Dendrothele bispora CBS 962.96]|uniref:Uncharacterized protein n=1 Tax=Dendrothele bispora (strain CBS 962.96) TaxID=1314807 RepID=A0A4V4HAX2_DENBC|nr:hypothetical protein K435DRAFT_812771 [Dendrothele bispora CBS 962.96]
MPSSSRLGMSTGNQSIVAEEIEVVVGGGSGAYMRINFWREGLRMGVRKAEIDQELVRELFGALEKDVLKKGVQNHMFVQLGLEVVALHNMSKTCFWLEAWVENQREDRGKETREEERREKVGKQRERMGEWRKEM